MGAMFQECNELEYLDLSNFDTSNVIDMGNMFFGCHKLKEIKGINNFNTNKVTNMNGMFQDCNELEYLILYKFNNSNAPINNKELLNKIINLKVKKEMSEIIAVNFAFFFFS